MKEFDFIKQLDSTLPPSTIELSIGDDAACFDQTLVSKDLMVEGVHFTDSAPIADIIFKLFTSNVSDIAAMGGTAEHVLLGISLPPNRYDESALVQAVQFAADYYQVNVIGGDTTSSKDSAFFSLTVIGRRGRDLLTRSGAKPGDRIFISRPLGFAQLGLMQELTDIDHGLEPYAHYRLTAEKKLGALLGESGAVTSCIDISDGLGSEACHLAVSSGVTLRLMKPMLPLDELISYSDDPLDLCIGSGEEYALLFTVKETEANALMASIRTQLGIDIIEIGSVVKGAAVAVLSDGISEEPLIAKGYEHQL